MTSPASADAAQIRVPVARGIELTKSYGTATVPVHALAGVSVDFYQGQFTAIMGPSGSGKSTLLHCLAGLDSPSAGSAVIAGEDLTAMSERQLTAFRRQHLGFIFQSFNLLPMLTAEQNIRLPLELARRKVDAEWFDQVVKTVGLTDRLGHLPGQLSGGQQQRVACARALVAKPDLIFADEPTGNLDSGASAEVLTLLRRAVTDDDQTVVMVTHEPDAAAYADRVVFLADGRIVAELLNPTTMTVFEQMAKIRLGAAARAA